MGIAAALVCFYRLHSRMSYILREDTILYDGILRYRDQRGLTVPKIVEYARAWRSARWWRLRKRDNELERLTRPKSIPPGG